MTSHQADVLRDLRARLEEDARVFAKKFPGVVWVEIVDGAEPPELLVHCHPDDVSRLIGRSHDAVRGLRRIVGAHARRAGFQVRVRIDGARATRQSA